MEFYGPFLVVDGGSTGDHAWRMTWLWSQSVSLHCFVTFAFIVNVAVILIS